ncbi:MAG: tetratricopeptide repeat protein [Methanotrichaceae archaeon]|nr:tetratricopeptide repeat protein [Methanotrichaceae archaeon]
MKISWIILILLGIIQVAPALSYGEQQGSTECNFVARVIFSEAGPSCSDEERELVASVIVGRINNLGFDNGNLKTMYQVVSQGGAFSCIGDSNNNNWAKSADPEKMSYEEKEIWTHCYLLASGSFQQHYGSSGNPVVYYHDKSISKPSSWDNNYWYTVKESETDHFIFYSIMPVNKPVLISPGSISEPSQSINSISPTFLWDAIPNADSYALYISRHPYGTGNLVFNSDNDVPCGYITGESFELPIPLREDTRYRWNMKAHYCSGTWSDISSPLYFQVSAPTETSIGSQQDLNLNLNLNLQPITPESAKTTTPMLDGIHPMVQAFQVSPQSLTCGMLFTIEYTVSDTGGSGISRVELWRKDGQSDWQEINRNAVSGGDGPISGSFTDVPLNAGRYWYGIHVADNAGNWNDEKNSNSNNNHIGFNPFEVKVMETQSTDAPMNNGLDDWLLVRKQGISLFGQGEYEEAIDVFDEGIRRYPNKADFWERKGWVLKYLGKYDEAIKCYDEAIRLSPKFSWPWSGKGDALNHLGNYEDAIKACDEALRLSPDLASAWYNKGVALEALGRATEADVAFNKAKELGYEG